MREPWPSGTRSAASTTSSARRSCSPFRDCTAATTIARVCRATERPHARGVRASGGELASGGRDVRHGALDRSDRHAFIDEISLQRGRQPADCGGDGGEPGPPYPAALRHDPLPQTYFVVANTAILLLLVEVGAHVAIIAHDCVMATAPSSKPAGAGQGAAMPTMSPADVDDLLRATNSLRFRYNQEAGFVQTRDGVAFRERRRARHQVEREGTSRHHRNTGRHLDSRRQHGLRVWYRAITKRSRRSSRW